jgi:hypothetical protein
MLDAIVNDQTALGVVLSLMGLVGGGFLSWLFTFFYFKKGQSRRLLCYTTRSSEYLGYSEADFHGLPVHYGNKQLQNPVRYTVYIWNCGNVTLNNSDISTVDPLAFGQSQIEILETAPIWSTRESINPTLILDASKTKLFVNFDFLDPSDGIAVQFLADRPSAERRWPDRLQAYGTIKGLNRAPFHVAAAFDARSWWSTYAGMAALLFFAFCTGAIVYDAWLSGMVLTSIIKVLAAIIFGLISIGIAIFTFEGIGDRTFVVPALLRRPDESESEGEGELKANLDHLMVAQSMARATKLPKQ